MTTIIFSQRIGQNQGKPIDDDFPPHSRIALAHLLIKLVENNHTQSATLLINELYRSGRFIGTEFGSIGAHISVQHFAEPLLAMDWHRVYTFCERVYLCQLSAHYEYRNDLDEFVEVSSLDDARRFFSSELSLILAEDNLSYQFIDGFFQRRGRAHTQISVQRAGSVLSSPRLALSKHHYNKARRFFIERPMDVENCIKEAICSLEAGIYSLAQIPAYRKFSDSLKPLIGTGERQIHPSIAEGIIKLHAYRGSAMGIAHAAPQGASVSEVDAELVLSLVASYITYFYDLFFVTEDDIPF